MNQDTILCLDDDVGRHEVFKAAMRDYRLVHTYEIVTFAQAVRETQDLVLISLDHDLGGGVNRNRETEGCGCDAAELVGRYAPPEVPVLIHSDNRPAAQAMRTILVRTGRNGRIGRVSFSAVADDHDSAMILRLRTAVTELIANPCWPDDVTTDDLLDLLGDDVSAVCPYRAAKGRR